MRESQRILDILWLSFYHASRVSSITLITSACGTSSTIMTSPSARGRTKRNRDATRFLSVCIAPMTASVDIPRGIRVGRSIARTRFSMRVAVCGAQIFRRLRILAPAGRPGRGCAQPRAKADSALARRKLEQEGSRVVSLIQTNVREVIPWRA